MDKLRTFIEYNNTKIYFKVIFKKKKNISIKVDNNGEVFVLSPYDVRDDYIKKLVTDNSKWIINTINKKKEMTLFEQNKIIYKGKVYNVHISIKEIEGIELADDFIVINSKINDRSYIYQMVSNWYKKNAMEFLPLRVKAISENLGITPSRVLIKNQKSIWGSCNTKREIRLNWRLILMKESVIDYIIIHELCHIIHMNHSKDFWSLVKSYDSNYEENKVWLKEKGTMLMKIT